MPQNPNILATRTVSGDVFIYDLNGAREWDFDDTDVHHPICRLVGHKEEVLGFPSPLASHFSFSLSLSTSTSFFIFCSSPLFLILSSLVLSHPVSSHLVWSLLLSFFVVSPSGICYCLAPTKIWFASHCWQRQGDSTLGHRPQFLYNLLKIFFCSPS
jgi:hypothetical protein